MGAAMSALLRRRARVAPADDGLGQPLLHEEQDDVPTSGSAAPRRRHTDQRELPWPLSAVVHAAVAAWRFLLGLLHRLLPASRRIVPLSPLQEERLAALQRRAVVTFDGELPQHQAALRELWGAAFPGAPFPMGVRHEQWKELGFQSDQPARDLSRGAGMLTLECLLWMAHERPATFHALSRKTAGVRAEWEYPFAAGGANVAFMLAELLGLRGGVGAGGARGGASGGAGPVASPAARGFLPLLDPTLPGSDEGGSTAGGVAGGAGGGQGAGVHGGSDGGATGSGNGRQFEQLFELTFRLLDAVWLERKAGYMQFPAVMGEVREQVERALAGRSATSMAELELLLLPAA